MGSRAWHGRVLPFCSRRAKGSGWNLIYRPVAACCCFSATAPGQPVASPIDHQHGHPACWCWQGSAAGTQRVNARFRRCERGWRDAQAGVLLPGATIRLCPPWHAAQPVGQRGPVSRRADHQRNSRPKVAFRQPTSSRSTAVSPKRSSWSSSGRICMPLPAMVSRLRPNQASGGSTSRSGGSISALQPSWAPTGSRSPPRR